MLKYIIKVGFFKINDILIVDIFKQFRPLSTNDVHVVDFVRFFVSF